MLETVPTMESIIFLKGFLSERLETSLTIIGLEFHRGHIHGLPGDTTFETKFESIYTHMLFSHNTITMTTDRPQVIDFI